MLSFKELAKIVQARYKLNMAEANQTVKLILSDFPSDNLMRFTSESAVHQYLDMLEEIGREL